MDSKLKLFLTSKQRPSTQTINPIIGIRVSDQPTVMSYFLPVTIVLPSLIHVTRGLGIPFASHLIATSVPSKTNMSASGMVTTGVSKQAKNIAANTLPQR